MNPFKQRSSVPSSLLTALVGWIGWLFIGPLMFSFAFPAKALLMIALVSAVIQVAFLRIFFFALQMQRSLFIGIFWGLASAIALYYVTASLHPQFKEHFWPWMLIYAYIGAPVGGFLSYFYRDDKKIFDENPNAKKEGKFGRDAHWLEPFAYGVVGFLIAYLPFQSFDLFVNVFIVGAISGVAAAGASHFSPDKWKRSFLLLALIILVLGGGQGAITGLLFRSYAGQFYAHHILLGMIGGIITYFITFLRGRYLANKESKGEL